MITRYITIAFVILQLCSNVLLQRDRGPPDVSASDRQFRVVYEWRTLDFAYRSEQERSAAIFRGEYVPRNVIISDVKPYANRLYLVRALDFFSSSLSLFKYLNFPLFSQSRECCQAVQQHSVTSSLPTTTDERILRSNLIRVGK